jgi:hypothetical protein
MVGLGFVKRESGGGGGGRRRTERRIAVSYKEYIAMWLKSPGDVFFSSRSQHGVNNRELYYFRREGCVISISACQNESNSPFSE